VASSADPFLQLPDESRARSCRPAVQGFGDGIEADQVRRTAAEDFLSVTVMRPFQILKARRSAAGAGRALSALLGESSMAKRSNQGVGGAGDLLSAMYVSPISFSTPSSPRARRHSRAPAEARWLSNVSRSSRPPVA